MHAENIAKLMNYPNSAESFSYQQRSIKNLSSTEDKKKEPEFSGSFVKKIVIMSRSI